VGFGVPSSVPKWRTSDICIRRTTFQPWAQLVGAQAALKFVRFGFSTVQHWYYRACKEGTHPIVYEELAFSEYLRNCAGISREDKENVIVAAGIIRPQFECYGHHRHFSPLPLA
jgi:hypothetical protein